LAFKNERVNIGKVAIRQHCASLNNGSYNEAEFLKKSKLRCAERELKTQINVENFYLLIEQFRHTVTKKIVSE